MSDLLLLLGNRKRPKVDFTFMGGALSPFLTFARASNAMRFNSSGLLETVGSDTPRFGYDPLTHAPRGLLIEPQRTNLISYSNFASAWGSAGAGTSLSLNKDTSPDGTLNGTRIIENTATGTHGTYYGRYGITFSAKLVFSAFVKAGTRTAVNLAFSDGGTGGPAYKFDLVAGTFDRDTTVSAGTWTGYGASMQSCGNGWYRCCIFGVNNYSSNNIVYVYLRNAAGSGYGVGSYTGDGASYVSVFGAQLEDGTACTSFISTTSAVATSASDQLSFTVPTSVTKLRYTFDDNTTQDVSVSAGAYSVPTNLNRPHVKRITSV